MTWKCFNCGKILTEDPELRFSSESGKYKDEIVCRECFSNGINAEISHE